MTLFAAPLVMSTKQTVEGTLDRLTAQNFHCLTVPLRPLYHVVKEMTGASGSWAKMVMRFTDLTGKGLYAELRGKSRADVLQKAEPYLKAPIQVKNLKTTKNNFFAGHFVDLSDKGSKVTVTKFPEVHPKYQALKASLPVPRLDLSLVESTCQGRQRHDLMGLVTDIEAAPTKSKPKTNVWLKDFSDTEILINVWGPKLQMTLRDVQPGDVLMVDNCNLHKKDDSSVEGSVEHFEDSEKHSFGFVHVNPNCEQAKKLQELGTSRGKAISLPWAPSLVGGGRLKSDLGACYVACAATVAAYGMAVEDGAPEDRCYFVSRSVLAFTRRYGSLVCRISGAM